MDWMLTDHLGSVRDNVNVNGSKTNHIRYDAFGNIKSEWVASSWTNDRPRFTGKFFDKEAGLQYNMHRWYEPSTGTWVSQDPIGFGGGDYNLYRYSGNGPATYTDPTGTCLTTGDSNYRDAFRKATPDLPEDWQVHHTLEQRLRDRFAKAGYNIDDPKYLKGIHPKVHERITAAQNKWWNDWIGRTTATGHYISDLDDAYTHVPLNTIKSFYSDIEQSFSDLWVDVGDSKKIAQLQRILCNDGVAASIATSRFMKAMKVTGVAIKFFAVLELTLMGRKIAQGADVPEFQALLDQYQYAVDEQFQNNRISNNRLYNVIDALDDYLKAIGCSDSTIPQVLRSTIDVR